MKLKGITDIFFDLDHTLWDFDKNSALTFDKIFKTNNVNVNLNEFLSHYEPINFNYWKLYREEKIDKESLRYGRLFDAFNAVNYKIDDALIDKLADDYIEQLPSFNYLFDGTFEILDYLKPKYKLHIITNGFKEVQEGKLNNSKINHYFKTVTNSEMVGVKKPNPKIFNFSLKLANADAAKSIMIGDNIEADVLGAVNMGLDAIHFNPNQDVSKKHIKQVAHLLDLKDYL